MKIWLVMFGLFVTSLTCAEVTLREKIASIGEFHLYREGCDLVENFFCDYALYQHDVYRLALINEWERALVIENLTSEFLHLKYGYTFNTQHSIFISPDGLVQALDEVLAVNEKTGCLVRYDRSSALIFQNVFSAKPLYVEDLTTSKYENLKEVLTTPHDIFLENQFNLNGDFYFKYLDQDLNSHAVVIKKPCG